MNFTITKSHNITTRLIHIYLIDLYNIIFIVLKLLYNFEAEKCTIIAAINMEAQRYIFLFYIFVLIIIIYYNNNQDTMDGEGRAEEEAIYVFFYKYTEVLKHKVLI